MTIKHPKICSATQKSDVQDMSICQSIEKYDLGSGYIHLNNRIGLPELYNNTIKQALETDCDCLILVHDDVTIEEDPIPKLEKLFDQFDMVGVAGTSKITLTEPALWHIMGGGFNGGNLHGCVQHLGPNNVKFPSNFGEYPHKVVMIDGVFMALNRKAMENVVFDENCPSKWHFYDLISSLDFHLKGGRVGVGDILITHESPGLREFTEEWKEGQKYFLKKYE